MLQLPVLLLPLLLALVALLLLQFFPEPDLGAGLARVLAQEPTLLVMWRFARQHMIFIVVALEQQLLVMVCLADQLLLVEHPLA